MPIYEYVCSTCGSQREVIQKFGAPAPVCPDCDNAAMDKQLSAHRVGASKGPCGEPKVGACAPCGVDRPPCAS